MSAPILVPAALLGLRAGLPCVVDGEAWVYVGATTDGAHQFARCSPDATLPSRMVVDESVRVCADLRKLRPQEPEPLTAPLFECSYGAGMVPDEDDDFADRLCWYLGPDGDACMFIDAEQVAPESWGVRGLERIGLEAGHDRDLLALQAVVLGVFGG